jgi:hypothetical protein
MTQRPDSFSLPGLGSGLPTVDPAAHATLYIVIARLCLLLALRFLARALASIGPLARAASAAAMATVAVATALTLVTFAVFGGGLS